MQHGDPCGKPWRGKAREYIKDSNQARETITIITDQPQTQKKQKCTSILVSWCLVSGVAYFR